MRQPLWRIDEDPESPRDRLKARAAALGMLATRVPHGAEQETTAVPPDLDRIARLTAGWGAQLDEIVAEDRERL